MFQLFGVTYYATSSTSGVSGALIWTIVLLALVVGIVEIAGTWKVFKKAGKPGWAAIVPIYNFWVLFEIAGKPGWWAFSFLLSFIPFVGWIVPLVLEVIAMLEVAKRFGQSVVFAVLGLILFPFVGYPILGFGDAKYKAGASSQPPVPTTTPQSS